MVGIIGIIAALTVLGLSLVVTRIATIALASTGLSWEAARFQARSAYTGTGFTTSEAEKVVDHPVRRRIIMLLMIARSAGIVSIVISLVLSFGGAAEGTARLLRLLWLLGGVGALWAAARSRHVKRWMNRWIQRALQRWTDLDARDYQSLLKLSGDYSVKELKVRKGDWVANKKLAQCRLSDEGVLVLGIYRDDGAYLGAPTRDSDIHAGDTLILYGRGNTLRELDRRRADATGDEAHNQSVKEQKKEEAVQEREDRTFRQRRESEKRNWIR
jgi:hypothetical protein